MGDLWSESEFITQWKSERKTGPKSEVVHWAWTLMGLFSIVIQDKKDKDHHHHRHHHRHHKKSTSDDVAGPASELLVATGSIESPNAEQYSVLLQTSASASDVSSATNGPAVNILCIHHFAPSSRIECSRQTFICWDNNGRLRQTFWVLKCFHQETFWVRKCFYWETSLVCKCFPSIWGISCPVLWISNYVHHMS